MKKIVIDVTKGDIAHGHVGLCPIERAAVRAGMCSPSASDIMLWYEPWSSRESVVLPTSAQAFIKKYDSKKPVKPFRFTLKVNL